MILKIFSGNAGSIELSFEKKNYWYSSLISSDDPSFGRLELSQLASLTGVVDYQLIANSKLRFAKPRP